MASNSTDSDSEDPDFIPQKDEDDSTDDDNFCKLNNNRIKKDSIIRKEPLLIPETFASNVDEKQRVESLWRSFKSDVGQTSLGEETNCLTVSETETHSPKKENKKDLKNNIFEYFDEKVPPSAKEISTDQPKVSLYNSPQIKEVDSKSAALPSKRTSISFALESISKKKKLSVLEKSQLDWQTFTQEEGLTEDLKHHRLGKDSYVEKKRFLERSDFRSFEIEKKIRHSDKKKL